jgi:hypothetical protein
MYNMKRKSKKNNILRDVIVDKLDSMMRAITI